MIKDLEAFCITVYYHAMCHVHADALRLQSGSLDPSGDSVVRGLQLSEFHVIAEVNLPQAH